jgi:hypothetical protein
MRTLEMFLATLVAPTAAFSPAEEVTSVEASADASLLFHRVGTIGDDALPQVIDESSATSYSAQRGHDGRLYPLG